jgi:hypothetical protein
MLDELSAVEKSVKEVLIDMMDKRVMSTGIQASSTQGVQSSTLTSLGSGPSRPAAEKRTKHIDDLTKEKLIPTILPNYILPLASAISHDTIPRDFDYTMFIAYLLKGIRAVQMQQGKIVVLNFSDFNLGDHKNYNMLSPYKYLTRTKGKKSKIIPQPWTMNLMQSTLLNEMKIPHFGRH